MDSPLKLRFWRCEQAGKAGQIPRRFARKALLSALVFFAAIEVNLSTNAGNWARVPRPGNGLAAVAVTNDAAIELGTDELLTIDLGDPDKPRVVLRRALEMNARVGRTGRWRDGTGLFQALGGFAFVATRAHGVQVYDVSNPRSVRFVGHFLPCSVQNPVSVGRDGDQVVLEGCMPAFHRWGGHRHLPKVSIRQAPWRLKTKACQPAAFNTGGSDGGKGADAGPPIPSVMAGTDEPHPERETSRLATEDSWYALICSTPPLPDSEALVQTGAEPGTMANRQEAQRRVRLRQLAARIGTANRRSIEVALVTGNANTHYYSELEQMVNRRADPNRYR